MCGIAGTIGTKDESELRHMLSRLSHRGPDDHGEYVDPEKKVFIGQRRLAIIDLSPGGHQPMSDEAGNIWVTYNGEIYNYKELTEDLKKKGHRFRSSSDTEVLIHGYKEYGSDIFKKIDGMWAAALYDRQKSLVILSRDQAGIKPLYYSENDSRLYFASEIGALRTTLPQKVHLDQRTIMKYLAHGYVYGEQSIYRDIRSLPKASCMLVHLDSGKKEIIQTFTPKGEIVPRSLGDAINEFDSVFKKSVAGALQADVPVGIFLSGGIDSTLVAYYAKQNGALLHTFTIGFEESSFDESRIAARIAKQFGFPSTIAIMSGNDAARDLEKILDSFGQPFADMSAIPTHFLSRLARDKGYKVVLGGDGADELFGGYPTHFLPALSRWYQKTPRFTDRFFNALAKSLPENFSKLGKKELLTRFLSGARMDAHRAHATWKRVFSDNDLEQLLMPDFKAAHKKHDSSFDRFFAQYDDDLSIEEKTIRADFDTFLEWNCLVKSDISAMQNSIEARVPFLNKPVIEFANSLPTELKVRPFKSKILLRAVLEKKGGGAFSDLPKRGFSPPLSRWLCSDLKSAMLSTLSPENVAKVGFLRREYIESLMEEHLTRRNDHARKIWALMSLVRFFSRTV